MNRTIGLVTTNFNLSDYGVLAEDRPVAAVPFGGRYRLLDFALSNMVNSHIYTVGLITPHHYRSIMDHIGAGKEWGLDRKSGGLYILPGSVYGLRDTEGRFLFRDMLHNLGFLKQGDGDYVLVASGSLVANIDYQPMIDQQEVQGSQVTLLYSRTAGIRDRKGYYLTLDDQGAVKDVNYTDSGENLFLNSFLIEKSLLLRLADNFSALGYLNFIDVLKMALPNLRVGSYRFDGHIAYMDTVQDYFNSSLELTDREVRRDLFSRERRIYTKIHDAPPALCTADARVHHSILTSGSVIDGTVENSVLFRSVHIGKGAKVKNCVLMEKCVVGEGAVLENVICDKYAVISAGTVLKGTRSHPCVLSKESVI